MKQVRLRWLLGAMCVLAIARVLVPPTVRDAPPGVAEAIVRRSPVAVSASAAASAPAADAVVPGVEAIAHDEPGNAFTVRPPPLPPYVPSALAVKATSNAVLARPAPVPAAIPSEPLVAPMPYQVIGTWDDGQRPGVFLSSPQGTLLARQGATLQAEYKVKSITTQQISLVHIPSGREATLAISRPPATPPPYP